MLIDGVEVEGIVEIVEVRVVVWLCFGCFDLVFIEFEDFVCDFEVKVEMLWLVVLVMMVYGDREVVVGFVECVVV